jgi:hypothetical protein
MMALLTLATPGGHLGPSPSNKGLGPLTRGIGAVSGGPPALKRGVEIGPRSPGAGSTQLWSPGLLRVTRQLCAVTQNVMVH